MKLKKILPKPKTLIEYLEAVESNWLITDYWSCGENYSQISSLTHIDYNKLKEEIDRFTETFKK